MIGTVKEETEISCLSFPRGRMNSTEFDPSDLTTSTIVCTTTVAGIDTWQD